MTNASAGAELDLALLAGFSYACRPDCGLCCYTEPFVAPEERSPLLEIRPAVELVMRGRESFVSAGPDGAACGLLESHRCRGHAARPAVCREFPLTVHVGERLQASVVLTCPGVELGSLAEFGGSTPRAAPIGFDTELASVRLRLDRGLGRRREDAVRRRRRVMRDLEARGRWEDETRVRSTLGARLPSPGAEEFPVEDPPEADEGLEYLPLVFDRRAGPVAFAAAPGGWELLELRPQGGVARSLGVVPPPGRPPSRDAAADRLLEGYLRYWLSRDALFGAVHLGMQAGDHGTVSEWVAAQLRGIGALVLSRAYVWAGVHRGDVGELREADVAAGVRAVDQDLLDRDSWGQRL